MDNENWLVSNSDKLYFITNPVVIEDINKVELSDKTREFVTSLTKDKSDEDLLWFSGIYCTANIRNENGDGFLYDDLKVSANTPKYKPVNWLHKDEERIGVIVESSFVDEGNEKGHIQVIGVVWKASPKDAKYIAEINKNYRRGKMGLSMECFGDVVRCSACKEEFPIRIQSASGEYSHYCEHLQNRKINGTTRLIRNPLFVGLGFIPAIKDHEPADQTAWVKEIASLINDKGENKEVTDMTETTYTQEQVNTLIEAEKTKQESELKKQYDKMINDNVERMESMTKEYETKIEELTSELESTKAELERLTVELAENGISVEDVDAIKEELASTKEELEKATSELNEFKEKEEAKIQETYEARIAELKEKADISDELAETLREHILDDEKYEALKKVMVKEEAENVDETKTKVKFESHRTPSDAASKLREAMKEKE